MNVKVIVKEDNYVELLLEGEDHSIPNAICELLLEDSDVEFASYVFAHPLTSPPKLIVRTKKKDPIALVKKAATELGEQAAELSKAFEKKKSKKEK